MVEQFRATVWEYYDRAGRQFPWRDTRDPYEILVSEVMLQQTQTYRVLPKYTAFLQKFPTLISLAQARLHDVLSAWQGLGFNRRGLMLQKATQVIEKQGEFPHDPAELVKLPGVGPYTAAAVATFAFGARLPFIETNIRTVFLHHFFPKQTKVHDRDLLPLIAQTIDSGDVRHWYYALMDYGVLLKKQRTGINARSAHYAKQSKFEGSDREIRGAIVRLLTTVQEISLHELMHIIDSNPDRVQKIISQLASEGLLEQSNDTVQIS